MGLFNVFKKHENNNESDIYNYNNYEDEMGFYAGCFYMDEASNKNTQYEIYSFFAGSDEVSDDFGKVSTEIIKDILKDYRILTKLAFWDIDRDNLLEKYNITDQMDYIPEIRNKYGNNLKENGVLFKAHDKFIILSNNGDIPITPLDIEIDKIYASCFYEIYGLNTDKKVDTFDDANDLIAGNKYDIFMDYAKFPDYLEINIKPDKFNLYSIIKTALNICTKYKKSLSIYL
ncbi:MAG: hypothetical protein LKJ25_04905 [Clostridia bacterium]|jgi:hypothetical protein|nr:hypothetical protein [Clostridia bacterium]